MSHESRSKKKLKSKQYLTVDIDVMDRWVGTLPLVGMTCHVCVTLNEVSFTWKTGRCLPVSKQCKLLILRPDRV